MVPTFQDPHHRSQPPVLSVSSLRWSAAHCLFQNVVLLDTVPYEKTYDQREPSPGCMVSDQTFPIENAAGASLLQLLCAAEHFHITRSTMNFSCIAPLHIKKSNYSTHFTFDGRLYCVRHVYVLIAQHICAKLHLIFTVLLISRLIGSWEKETPYVQYKAYNSM